jgi:glycosyltransferase involved in cell wall biosynthesis
LKRTTTPYILRANRKAKRLINISDYDACHCFFGIPSGIVAYLNRLRVPYITSLHGYDVPRPDEDPFPFITAITRFLLKGASTVISPITQPNLPVTDVIPNGVDTQAFFPRPHSLLRRIHLLTVGKILERKGLAYLLVAMKELKDEIGDGFELSVVGGVGEKQTEWKLKRIVEQFGLRVKFLGHVPHSLLQPIYASSDIFVLPSLSESFSNATIEAMACGLPIITTNTGAVAQCITPENGIIVPIKDSKSLANAIYTVADEDTIRRMGKESRKIAETFSWKNTARKYIDLYAQISAPTT